MRRVTYAMVEVEDRLKAMRDYLDEVGLTNAQGEPRRMRSEEHTSELQLQAYHVCRLLLEKKKYTLLISYPYTSK